MKNGENGPIFTTSFPDGRGWKLRRTLWLRAYESFSVWEPGEFDKYVNGCVSLWCIFACILHIWYVYIYNICICMYVYIYIVMYIVMYVYSDVKRLHTHTQRSFCTHRRLYTQNLSHREAFTQRSFYRQTPLHTEAFTHREVFTQRSFYTHMRLHTSSYTEKPLHSGAFTQRSLYTEELLHRHFYTEKSLHRWAFTQRSSCTAKLLHTDAFTCKRFYMQKLLHREAFAKRTLATVWRCIMATLHQFCRKCCAPGPGQPFCASLRNRNAHGHVTRAYKSDFVWEFSGEMPRPRS